MKKMISLVMCLVMVLCMVPITAFGSQKGPSVYFVGNSFSLRSSSTEGWSIKDGPSIASEYVKPSENGQTFVAATSADNSYIYATYTDAKGLEITLKNVNLDADIIIFGDNANATITLEGNSYINPTQTIVEGGTLTVAIGGFAQSLTIKGDGKLTIGSAASYPTYGIGFAGGDLIISDNATIEIYDSVDGILTADYGSYAPGSVKIMDSTVIIHDIGIASASDCTRAEDFDTCAIHSDKDIIVTNSNITATSKNAFGMYAVNTISIDENSTVVASTESTNANITAIYASETNFAGSASEKSDGSNAVTFTKENLAKYKYISTKKATTEVSYGGYYVPATTTNIQSAKTGDTSILLYAGLTLTSILGMGYVSKKKEF